MNINKVKISNFKGRSGEFEFAPVTVITGDNYAGKSTIQLAVRLALTGFLPAPIGKENRSIFEALAGNPHEPGTMEVGFEISDSNLDLAGNISGFLRWTKNSKDVVSRDGAVPGGAALPAILCEPRTFFGMSGPERVRAIFEAVPDAKVDVKAFLGTVGEIMATPARTRDEAVEWITTKTKGLFESSPDQMAAAKLEELLKAELKRAKDTDKMKTGAVQGASAPTGIVPEDHSTEIVLLETALKDSRGRVWSLEQTASGIAAASAVPEKIKELREELGSLKGSEPKIDSELPAKVTQAQKELSEAKAEQDKQADMVRRWTRAVEAVQAGKCPTCGCEGEAIRKRIDEMKKFLADAKAALMKANNLFDTVKAKLEKLADQRETQSDALSEFRSSQNRINEIESEIKGLEAVKTPSAPSNLSELHAAALKEVADAEVKLAALRAKQTDFIAHRQNRARRDTLETELLEARCWVEVLNQSVKLLAAEVAKATEKAFGKVLSVADQFTTGILNSRLEFMDGQLGRRVSAADIEAGCKAKEGSWISHETFSGTEELIAYAAFAVALANRAPFKLVVMDELGRMAEDRRVQVVERMAELIKSGTIHQFIGVDVDAKAWKKCKSAKLIKI